MEEYGVIDGGSNTIRLLVARRTETGIEPIKARQAITRVGEGLEAKGEIQKGPWLRTRKILRDYSPLLDDVSFDSRLVALTGAFRRAKNGSELADRVARLTGCRTVILSGGDEARLTALGVMTGLGKFSQPTLVLDLGGTSLEIILITAGGVMEIVDSIPVGAVFLAETYLKSDPPRKDEVLRLREAVMNHLSPYLTPLNGGVGRLVGTAGTATTLAALDLKMTVYNADHIQGHRLSRDRLQVLTDRLLAIPVQVRRSMPGMDPGREDILPAGAVVFETAMDLIRADELTIADWGLREGLVIALADKPSWFKPVLASAHQPG